MQTSEVIRTRDGQQLTLTFYLPEASGGQVLVIGPGASAGQIFYSDFAHYCAELTGPVVTFDYRGIGLSGPGHPKGVEATLMQWANHDLDAVLLFVKKKFPEKELVLLGHGLSGQIAGLAPASQYIRRLILLNSALSCWRLWPLRSQLQIFVLKIAGPIISSLNGYFPGKRLGYFQDLPAGVLAEWSDWCNHPNGLFDVFPDSNYRKLDIPLLALSFSDDWYAPPRAVKALLVHYSSARQQWRHFTPEQFDIPEVGHDGFFTPACRQLWPIVPEWMAEVHSVLPSR